MVEGSGFRGGWLSYMHLLCVSLKDAEANGCLILLGFR
jgi:hypothetical protein